MRVKVHKLHQRYTLISEKFNFMREVTGFHHGSSSFAANSMSFPRDISINSSDARNFAFPAYSRRDSLFKKKYIKKQINKVICDLNFA